MTAIVLTEQRAYSGKAEAVRRPKLLFLAYYFPPLNSSACVRTWNIAKYLSRLGWEVTVVSPHPRLWRKVNDLKQVEADLHREGVRRLSTGHRWRWLSPWDLKCWNANVGWLLGGICRNVARRLGIDTLIGWGREVEKACAALTPGDVDLILASGPPFIGFSLAKALSDRLNCPYVLDYRDPWVVRHRFMARRGETFGQENEIVEASSAVTVISPSLLDGRFSLGSRFHVITNGFDPDELAKVRPYRFGHFAIVYAGNFYFPIRVVTPLMQALRRLKEKDTVGTAEWGFHYYGVHGDHVRQEAERFSVMDKVFLHGRVARDEALSAVSGANVAVVITALQAEVPGKLFEALGMRVPVLIVGPAGADVDTIVETTGLVCKSPAEDVEGMVAFFQEVMSGRVPSVKSPETYAWPNLIKDLDMVLRTKIKADRYPLSAPVAVNGEESL